MSKKLIISLLVLFSFTVYSNAFAQTNYPDIVGTKYFEPVEMLTELEVEFGYVDDNYHPERYVTRAEFSRKIDRLLRRLEILPDSAEEAPFDDVPIEHWASATIADVKQLGIMKGRNNNMFYPDANVTYEDAIYSMLKCLGYRDESISGDALLQMAEEVGLLKNVDYVVLENEINRGNMAWLIWNTLLSPTVVYEEESAGSGMTIVNTNFYLINIKYPKYTICYDVTISYIDEDEELIYYNLDEHTESITKVKNIDISQLFIGQRVNIFVKDFSNEDNATTVVLISKDVKGDINGDDGISIVDIRLLLQAFINSNEETSWNARDIYLMDLNFDGTINIVDIRLLLQMFINNQQM